MHPVGLAEDVICLKKHIRINYIPTTLSLQHSCPSIHDSLKYEGIFILFVLSLSFSSVPLCPKYYKIYLSYPNKQKKSWILNSICYNFVLFCFVFLFCFKIYLYAFLIMLQTLSILSSELEYSFEFSWLYVWSELHLWIPLFKWWQCIGHSYHFYPRRGLKWQGGLFAAIVVWKYMVIMLIDSSNHLLFHVTCDHFTSILLST